MKMSTRKKILLRAENVDLFKQRTENIVRCLNCDYFVCCEEPNKESVVECQRYAEVHLELQVQICKVIDNKMSVFDSVYELERAINLGFRKRENRCAMKFIAIQLLVGMEYAQEDLKDAVERLLKEEKI